MKFFIETIGCQMNVSDSDKITDYLLKSGLEKTDDILKSDLVLLNTCSVRFSAEHKAYSFLGRLAEHKKNKPALISGVIGCMAQHAGKQIKSRFGFVNFVLGAKELDKFPDIVSKFIDTDGISKYAGKSGIFEYVTIMRGCGNFCSYCIVPYVRGPENSVSIDEILQETEQAVNRGVREIILLGQNVNSYNYKNIDFTGLLKEVSAIKNLERIRFMTNHPKDFSDGLIDEIASNEKICKYIHLPLQSASDEILKKMNRKYTYENYKLLLSKIRSKIPSINITSDIIIGFPGETEEDFDRTLKAADDLEFGGLFIFKYSPRPNTPAYKMKDDVDVETKKRRFAVLLERSNEISKRLNEQYTGTIQKVLVDGYANGVCESRNSQNIKIFFDCQKDIKGQFANVKITKALANSMSGEICEC